MTIAVRDGFEPPKGDLISNIMLASRWSTPYYFSISLSPPSRREGVFATFTTLQFCGSSGIRTPDTLSSMTVFKTVPFNRSGKLPIINRYEFLHF